MKIHIQSRLLGIVAIACAAFHPTYAIVVALVAVAWAIGELEE